jgi:hypothetical protein
VKPDVITIESTRDRHKLGNACLIRWRAQEWYAPVADVRATAEDLFTCAAYADLIGELIRAGIPAHIITGLTTAMLKDRKPRHFGTAQTLYVLPGGSSARKAGGVGLSRRNAFHKGGAEGMLDPGEARAMGRQWFTVAEASESDTLFSTVLERAGWMQESEMDALFGLLNDIRGGTQTLDGGQ